MTEVAFVSMPFGDQSEPHANEWTRLYEFGLMPLERQLPIAITLEPFEPIRLFRADRVRRSLGLKTNVIDGLETCTFVLSVLTTSVVDGSHGLRLSNPNVLWELGYAEAIGKPIVVLADNESLRQLPILAGIPNVCTYSHEMVRAATTPEAREALHTIARDLVPYINVAVRAAQTGSNQRRRARVYPNRDAIQLASLIRTARRSVDVLTTNLNYFVRDKLHEDPNPIEVALQNGATVRIVTMDPESVIAEYRAKQLVRSEDIPGYRKELRDGIIQLFSRFGDHPQFHLHIYNDLPLQITTRVDSTFITSIVTRGERARRRIQIQFHENDEGVAESFISHFQSMFDTSPSVAGMKWVQDSRLGRA